MSKEEDDKLDIIIRQVQKINLGLYGDEDNKIVGMMQKHYELEADVKNLKDTKKWATAWIAGFSVAMSFIGSWIKSKLGL
jgi:hypothetical protein